MIVIKESIANRFMLNGKYKIIFPKKTAFTVFSFGVLASTTVILPFKVDITWDETDHERVTSLSRTFNKEELLDMDFQAYLASSSEEEEEEQQGTLVVNVVHQVISCRVLKTIDLSI